MNVMPEWLKAMVAEHQRTRPVRPDDREVRACDVRVLRSGGESAHVVVKSVHESHVVVHPAHPYVELAAHDDRVCRPESLGYALVVQEDLEFCALRTSLGPLLGVDHGDGYHGHHMAGSLDARWEFKAGEIHRVWHLQREALFELLGWAPDNCECFDDIATVNNEEA